MGVKGLQRFNENTTLRRKIHYLFIPLMVVLILVFGEISNAIYQHYIRELAAKDLRQRTDMLKKDIEFRLSKYRNVSDFFYSNTELRNILTEYAAEEKSDYEIADTYQRSLDGLFQANDIAGEYMVRIYLFGSYLRSDGRYVLLADNYPVKGFPAEVVKNYGATYWLHSFIANPNSTTHFTGDYLIYSRLLADRYSGKPLAVLNVEIHPAVIEEALQVIETGYRGRVSLSFEGGSEIIAAGSASVAKEEFVLSEERKINLGKNSLVLRIAYPEALLARMGHDQRKAILVIGLVFTLFAAGLGYILSRLVVTRMGLFIRKIEQIQAGTDLLPDIPGSDEIAVIDRCFTTMLRRLNENVQREHRLELEKETVKMELLQAQFNPHFLYNTLSVIRWSVLKKGDEPSGHILDRLVAFYRSTLSGGKSIVRIERELEIVGQYVEIQQYTYKRKYEVIYRIQDGVEHLFTLKFLLQPVVENAIVHGLSERPEDGVIVITVNRDEHTVVFSIADNGKGMEEARVQALNSLAGCVDAGEKSSYGIFNVARRIRLHFGEGYGIVYKSAPGEGTTVRITIPVCERETEWVLPVE